MMGTNVRSFAPMLGWCGTRSSTSAGADVSMESRIPRFFAAEVHLDGLFEGEPPKASELS